MLVTFQLFVDRCNAKRTFYVWCQWQLLSCSVEMPADISISSKMTFNWSHANIVQSFAKLWGESRNKNFFFQNQLQRQAKRNSRLIKKPFTFHRFLQGRKKAPLIKDFTANRNVISTAEQKSPFKWFIMNQTKVCAKEKKISTTLICRRKATTFSMCSWRVLREMKIEKTRIERRADSHEGKRGKHVKEVQSTKSRESKQLNRNFSLVSHFVSSKVLISRWCNWVK